MKLKMIYLKSRNLFQKFSMEHKMLERTITKQYKKASMDSMKKNNIKVSDINTQLKTDNVVVKVEEKGQALYTLHKS